MTAADHRHIMKIVIFALDDIFEEWNNINFATFMQSLVKCIL